MFNGGEVAGIEIVLRQKARETYHILTGCSWPIDQDFAAYVSPEALTDGSQECRFAGTTWAQNSHQISRLNSTINYKLF